MLIEHAPKLERLTSGTLAWWSDPLLEERGVVVAFSERAGGVSPRPYDSLNLAAHVRDDAPFVDANRTRFLDALGLARARHRLTIAEQVHSSVIAWVGYDEIGSGGCADGGRSPLPGTDAMITSLPQTPLLMCFADCVPIVLVAPGPTVAVVHAGWRGALAGLPGAAVHELTRGAGSRPEQILAYIGPHIGPCHYPVDETILSQFVHSFGTFARACSGGLDLGAVVFQDLTRSGVSSCRIATLGVCTTEDTEHFFSYRAAGGVTGRHAALACIRSSGRSRA